MKTLVVILCQTRELERTFEGMKRYLLGPTKADLGLCVAGDSEDVCATAKQYGAKHAWSFAEPEDWDCAFSAMAGRKDWSVLQKFKPEYGLFGGIANLCGSGAIIMYFRDYFRRRMAQEKILDEYDWLIFTRSDFQWVAEHPHPKLLNPEHLYHMDGEKYGGVSDRHSVVHRNHFSEFLSVSAPIFEDPAKLVEELIQSNGKVNNPETYIAWKLECFGLAEKIRFFPYCAYAIRSEGGTTRWSQGKWNERLGCYVKYPAEYLLSRSSARCFRNQEDWKEFFLGRLPARLRYLYCYLVYSYFSIQKQRKAPDLTSWIKKWSRTIPRVFLVAYRIAVQRELRGVNL